MERYTIEKILDLPFYTEGPAVDSEGNIYFTMLTGGEVGRWSREAGFTVWAKGDCPNGQLITAAGDHWVCESRSGLVSRYDARGACQGTVARFPFAGVQAGVPNDLVLASNGDLYFTDSTRHTGKVFCLSNDGHERVVAREIDYANGLALSHDEKTLYIAESYKNRILAVALREESPPVVWAQLPGHSDGDPVKNLPDGLALDQEGRLWVAHYGMQALQVLAPDGTWLFSIDTLLPLTSNLYFLSETSTEKVVIVTGGYGEPGPGAVMKIEVRFSL